MEKRDFQPGDWIIATKPRIAVINTVLLMPEIRKDYSFMNQPVRVHTVTGSHVIIDTGDDTAKHVISQYELNERGFVVAEEILVSLLSNNRSA